MSVSTRVLVPALIMLLCAGQTIAKPSPSTASLAYLPIVELSITAKPDPAALDIYQQGERITRGATLLGTIVTESDGVTTKEQLLVVARDKAAQLGADFVVVLQITTRSEIHTNPSYALALPFLHGIAGVVGGGSSSKTIPAMVVGAGVYNKAGLGIMWDLEARKHNHFIIEDISSYSHAEAGGLKRGDEVLEVNGLRMEDRRTQLLLYQTEPGVVLPMHVKRGAEWLDLNVETVALK
jgi:hypothetical protein